MVCSLQFDTISPSSKRQSTPLTKCLFGAIEFSSIYSFDLKLSNQLKEDIIFLSSFDVTRNLLSDFVDAGYKFKVLEFSQNDNRPMYFSSEEKAIVINKNFKFDAFHLAQELRHFWQFEVVDFNKNYFDKDCWATSFLNVHLKEADAHAFANMIYNKSVRQYGEGYTQKFGRKKGLLKVREIFVPEGGADNLTELGLDSAIMLSGFWEYFHTEKPRGAYSRFCADHFEDFCKRSPNPETAVLRSNDFASNYDEAMLAFEFGGLSYLAPLLEMEARGMLQENYFAQDAQIGLRLKDIERVKDEVDAIYSGRLDRLPKRDETPKSFFSLFNKVSFPDVGDLLLRSSKVYKKFVHNGRERASAKRRLKRNLNRNTVFKDFIQS